MKTGQVVFYSVLGLTVVAGGYLIYNKYFSEKKDSLDNITTPEGGDSTSTTQAPPRPTAPQANDNFPLQVGSKGANVTNLQLALNRINAKRGKKYADLTVDGTFGEKTKNAIYLLAGTKYYPVDTIKYRDIMQLSSTRS